jgi:hypothetical protein
MTTSTWVWAGAGGALIVGGTAAVVVANQRYNSLEALQGTQGYLDAWNSQSAGIKSLAIAGTVAIGAGVVAAGVGGWLYWRSDMPSVALVPTVANGGAGLLAVGRF